MSASISNPIGVSVSGGLKPREVVDYAVLAESLGYESVWVAEGHGGDQFALLSACAMATKRIRLGTSISSVFVRTLPTILFVIGALTAGGIISAIFSLHINGDLLFDQINFWLLGLDILLSAYTLLPYISITFFLAVATRSAVAAIGGCAAYGLIIESLLAQTLLLLPGRLGAIAKYLPITLIQSVLSASWTPPALMKESMPGLLKPLPAAAGITILTLSLFGIALWLFKRQDFSR